MTPRIYFGGSFDPVHIGHLRVAIEVHERLHLPVRMLPVADPLHRTPLLGSAAQRLHMLELAVEPVKGVLVDSTEITLGPPTFTSRTLQALRDQYSETPLGFVIGADAFSGITSWRNYPDVLDQCHFIVVNRPGVHDIDKILEPFATRIVADPRQWQGCGGTILPLALPPLDISATEVRDCLTSGRTARYLVPDAVLSYIEANNLYAH